jgi:hypothetical protein
MMRAARYRQEAKEIRAIANRATVPDLQRELLKIADRYDRLAESAEKGEGSS